jgi:transposase
VLDRLAAQRIYYDGMESTVRKLLELDSKVDELTTRISKLSKNSSNSSKPPSSDIVKPSNRAERRRDKKKRRKGGQLNHPKWERPLFGPDEVISLEHTLTTCPFCTGSLERLPDEPAKILQQIGFVTQPVEKIEHRAPAYWCPSCQRIHYAPIPAEAVKQGLFKPDISATVCFLKYVGCMSLSAIKRYLFDAWGVKVTKGYLVKVLRKTHIPHPILKKRR